MNILQNVRHLLIAYDADGAVCATLEELVHRDPETGVAIAHVDFAAHEATGASFFGGKDHPGKECRAAKCRPVIWHVGNAVGSGSWPEFLPAEHLTRVRVKPDGRYPHRIRQIEHASGHVREREEIENRLGLEIMSAIEGARPAQLLRIQGDAKSPLMLDRDGKAAVVPRDRRRRALTSLHGIVVPR